MIISYLLIQIPNSKEYICGYYDIINNMELTEEGTGIFSGVISWINPATYAVRLLIKTY